MTRTELDTLSELLTEFTEKIRGGDVAVVVATDEEVDALNALIGVGNIVEFVSRYGVVDDMTLQESAEGLMSLRVAKV